MEVVTEDKSQDMVVEVKKQCVMADKICSREKDQRNKSNHSGSRKKCGNKDKKVSKMHKCQENETEDNGHKNKNIWCEEMSN